MPPHVVSDAAALASAWAVAVRVCERELVPEGYDSIHLTGVELLEAEARAAGYPLVASLVASSELYRRGDPARRAERPPVLSPFGDRFLAVEASCRAVISMELERLLDDPDPKRLAEVARRHGHGELADLLAEDLDGPALQPSLGL